MFIPIVIPASVRTHKKWIIDVMNIPFLGGYLIMLIALFTPFISGLIFSAIISSVSSTLSQNYWLLTLFLSGIIVFFWDKWLKLSYGTEIKLLSEINLSLIVKYERLQKTGTRNQQNKREKF